MPGNVSALKAIAGLSMAPGALQDVGRWVWEPVLPHRRVLEPSKAIPGGKTIIFSAEDKEPSKKRQLNVRLIRSGSPC